MMTPIKIVRGDDRAPVFKRFRSSVGEHLLIVPHSRIFDLTGDPLATQFDSGGQAPSHMDRLAEALAHTLEGELPMDYVVEPSSQSISLNVSSSCNLSCSYCYAARGAFDGAQSAPMKWEVARAAVDRLLSEARADSPVTIGFLGGEPFVNRRLIHQVVEYASAEGEKRALSVGFSVTTNGTLLHAEDIEMLRRHRFAVTVSIDGGEQIQNLQRPLPVRQEGSHALLSRATRPLLVRPGSAAVAARVTVMRSDLALRQRFEDILSLGFPEVGFAPLRADAGNRGALLDEDWPKYLEALKEIAALELERALKGGPLRLTNFAVALKQLHRGASSPYPCGAGGGYFSVAASGDWYACHRAIGSATYRLGNNSGIEPGRRREFLVARHVHSQPACRGCWARYLCSGGCHQEASSRTESACGFIRGWLEFCLASYCELAELRPDFFSPKAVIRQEELS